MTGGREVIQKGWKCNDSEFLMDGGDSNGCRRELVASLLMLLQFQRSATNLKKLAHLVQHRIQLVWRYLAMLKGFNTNQCSWGI
ncbi:hypothetical protein CEXT_41311 [Caerostris extrusa]|uniref:Transposase n=1 Tax=Caerostris extrusa TaxID=172846 RepID=A0AAV4TX36_CAEEX|nr:hypothetical protein CEXT_41311 [Caerostris extrusa]